MMRQSFESCARTAPISAGSSLRVGFASCWTLVAVRAKAHPGPYEHWYIDGGEAVDHSAALTCVSYNALEPARAALLRKMQTEIDRPGMGPEALRTLLAQMRPADLGMDREASSKPKDEVLERFEISLLTEGSGTQIFSTSFAQWAAREALRRAQPLTLLVRFAPRQRQKPMNELLSATDARPDLDFVGSLVDADMGAYYNWINQQRLPGAEQSSFLVWFEGHNQALGIGPSMPRGTESTSVADLGAGTCLDSLIRLRFHSLKNRRISSVQLMIEERKMDRRSFIRQTGTIIAGAALAPYALPEVDAQSNVSTASGRQVFSMNRNWRYSRHFVEGGHEKDFNDSGFDRVVIPHTNIPLPWHSFDEKSYEFVSLYRRRFKLPPEARGKRVFVDFEGVMTASTVWLNGVRLGEYKGGYTPFSFELTPHLDFDGENVLAVDVDSSERPDIPPFGYEIDYLTFGGIYREVSIRVVPATFLENIFVQPKNVLSGKPIVSTSSVSFSTWRHRRAEEP